MLPLAKTSPLHFAAAPEAVLPAIGVLNTWTIAAFVTPLAIGATVAALRARSSRQEHKSELQRTLRDFCEGR